MKMVAVLPLYNTSSTNDSHSIMNVTGKRFERNPSKTIWSYAPSDCLLKKGDRKWRSNQNQGYTPNNTTTLASNSLGNFSELLETYKLKQLSAVSFSNQATNTRNNDENFNHADTMTSSVFFEPNYRHKDSKVLSIEKKKLHNSSSIMNVDTKKSNESNNNNPMTNKSLVSFKDEDNIHVTRSYYFEFKDRKSLRSATKSEKSTLAETSYQNFTINPSVNVKSANSRKSAKTTSSNKSTTTTTLNDKLANGKHVVFGEHIDNLSNSLFSALSNGINKNLLSKNDNNKSVSSTMTLNSFHDDDYRDLSSLHKIYDREDSLVLKICNEIKSCKETNNKIIKSGEKSISDELSEKDELVSEFFKKEKSKSVKIAEPEVNFDLDSNKIFEYDDLEATSDFPASYFDCKSLEDEFEYKYQSAINKQYEQVLTQYDGNLPVEVALKQLLPDYSIIAQSAKSRRDSIDSKSSAYDMKKLKKKGSNLDLNATNKEADILNVLKRMMVKKKYEIATIRLEKASSFTNDKKKKRLTSAQPSAPAASAATSSILPSVKSARPKTSVITPAFIEIKPFTEDDDEEFEQIENDDVFMDEPKVNRCASCKKVLKASTDKCISEDDLYYNDYQITKEAFEQYEWPFEMNYSNSFVSKKEDEQKKQAASTKKSLNDNSRRCYSCAKVCFTDFSSKSEFTNFTEEKKAKSSQISSKKSPHPVMEADEKIKNDKGIKNVNSYDNINIDSKKISSNNLNNNNSNNSVNINKDVDKDACRFKNATFSSSRHCVSDNKLNDIIDTPPTAENKSNCAHSILMNSIEILKYQRKSSILPGKTFYSQRRQSISIRPPPLSKIKEDNVKEINTISFIYPIENVKLQSPRSEKSNGEIAAATGMNSKNKMTNSLHASVAVDAFKLDPFNPIKAKPPQKISNLKNEPISAFQIYKKTSKMICRRPKTAKN